MQLADRRRQRRATSMAAVAVLAVLAVSACGSSTGTPVLPTLRQLGGSGGPAASQSLPILAAPHPEGSAAASPANAQGSPAASEDAPTLPPATDRPRPTAATTPSPAAATSPDATAAPPDAPESATPEPAPSASPIPASAEPTAALTARAVWSGDGPSAAELAILAHVPDGLFTICNRTAAAWLKQVASINCQGPKAGVSYVSFRTQADMQAAYDRNVADLTPPPSSEASCGAGRYEGGYTIGGVHVGRWYCVDAVDQGLSWHEMEWTQERLRLIAFSASRLYSWPDFIDFTNGAGPLP